MKLLTVKDFIKYNNPCFNCKEKIAFTFITKMDSFGASGSFNPTIEKGICTVNLVNRYDLNSSIHLRIDLKTNKFTVSNTDHFEEYLRKIKIHLSILCPICHTHSESSDLLFNFDNQLINPVQVLIEDIQVKFKNLKYQIFTDATSSLLFITKPGNPHYILNLDLKNKRLLLSDLKTKENMIRKLRTYLTFS